MLIKSYLNNCKHQDDHETESPSIFNIMNDISEMRDRIYKLENKCASNDQYSRRNNVEISGIPDSVPNNQLEGMVIKILNLLNINLKFWDIEACHRLYKNPKFKSPTRVIVRFVNRKNTLNVLQRKKSLKNSNVRYIDQNINQIFISENLCPSYRVIYDFAYKLLRQDVLSHL